MGIRIVILTLLSIAGFSSYAQVRCATTEHTQALYNKFNKSYEPQAFEQWINKQTSRLRSSEFQRSHDVTYRIPVVVHVIHNGEAVGVGANISDEQIYSQIKVLNNDFNRLNADAALTPSEFQSLASNVEIEFVLARIDPDGNATTGILRKRGNRTSYSDSHDVLLKSQSYWPSENYLNIWVCNLGNLLGYAQFPVSDLEGLEEYQNEIATTDGVVVNYTAFGSIDDGDFDLDTGFDKGRTLTHEVGHFFGLRHIWGDDNGCTASDYVDDTPNQADETNGCPSHPQSSCSAITMFQNYMDYTGDACMNLFTVGQVDRMKIVLENSIRRVTLLSSPGLGEGGEESKNLALRSIESPTLVACADDTELNIRFQNLSTETITSVVLAYAIDGATQVTSTHDVEVGSFGYGEISIPVTLEEGSHTLEVALNLAEGETDVNPDDNVITQSLVINSATETLPARQRFENEFSESWSIVNPTAGATWEGYETNYGTSLTFETNDATATQTSWLVSPLLNLGSLSEANLRFDWSYRDDTQSATSLELKYSVDCGLTYQLLSSFSLGETTSGLIPNEESDWKSAVISLSPLIGFENARIAFVVSSYLGNGLYLDNIELYAGAASPKIPLNETVAIYPSNQGGVKVTFNVEELQTVEVEVFDIAGHRVLQGIEEDVLNQTYTLSLNHASAGIYIIRIQADGQYASRKVFLPGQ